MFCALKIKVRVIITVLRNFSIETHDSDEDDFDHVDEESRNDNKALYNSTNGFTIDQSSANSIMLADSVPGKAVPTGPLAPSLFPHVPPYVTFVSHEDKSVVMPEAIKKVLKWKLTTITPIVIRKIILNSGFRLLRRKYNNFLYWKTTAKGNFVIDKICGIFSFPLHYDRDRRLDRYMG